MKQSLLSRKRILTLLIALITGMGTAFAYDFDAVCPSGQTLYYNITDATNHYVAITYPGEGHPDYPGIPGVDYYWGDYIKPTGLITLPSTVTFSDITYTVKMIGDHAFVGCTGLTGSLTIPNSVTLIGVGAFNGCRGFTGTLTIPTSVIWIDHDAFSGCSGFTGSLIIPNSLTSIEHSTFSGCSGFTGSLIIPNSVTEIEHSAFSGCTGFNGSLTIPNSVTYIRHSAFKDCSGFTGSLIIPNSLTSIDENTFSGCSGFTGTLTIPNSVKAIGNCAFKDCSGFTGSLTIPNSVTKLWGRVFEGCTGLYGSLTIGTAVTYLGKDIIKNCNGITQVNYNAVNCADIINEDFPFSDFCGTLTIGSSVQRIPAYMFYDCDGFTGSLTIPASVSTIGDYAFYDCDGFTMIIVLPETPPDFDSGSASHIFSGLLWKQVYVPCGSLEVYQAVQGWSSFTNMQEMCDYLTYSINDDGVSVTVTGHVDGTAATGTLTIPPIKTIDGITYTVTAIGNNAFKSCSGLTGALVIPNSVTEIGDYAFYDCRFSGTLTLPNAVTTIGKFAFDNCYWFTGSLTIPNSVTTIGIMAFGWCEGFHGALTIGNAVTSIGNNAFSHCNFTSMTVFPEMPPVLGTNVFNNVPETIPVYVPCGSLEDYQAAEGWNVFTNMQCIPETLTVYEGNEISSSVPAFISMFDFFTRSQFVIPSDDLADMTGMIISSMTFYTTASGVPYTTVSAADVYLKEVDYTAISEYEPKTSATTVYSGCFDILNTDYGGKLTINFSTPYTYNGGNLLVGIENTEVVGYKGIVFMGQTVNEASISGSSGSTETIPATQRNFIPETTFGYYSTCEAKSLPYTYGFEEEDEYGCWTMLDCHQYTGRNNSSNAVHQGSYGFQFYKNATPPQYLISPQFDGSTGMNVSFYYRNISNNYSETFQVGFSTTTKAPSAFTWSDEVTANDYTTWMLYEDYFPEGTQYVAVKYTSNNQFMLFLDDFSFEPVSPTQAQTLSLASGANWFSAHVDITLDDLKAALVAALPGTNITVKGQNSNTRYLPAQNKWVGNLNILDLNQLYIITVSADAEITLEGTCINPAEMPVTIKNGTNWIAFPLDESMTLTDAFTGFAINGDVVKGQNNSARYVGNRWVGKLTTLEPGEGYLYNSAASGDRTFTFPAGE